METLYDLRSSNERLFRLIAGAGAGLVAAVPMSLALNLLHRRLPPEQKYPVPPRLITMEIAERTGAETLVDEEPEATLTEGLGHFGYSAASGAVFASLAPRLPFPPLLRGVVFGLALWIISYQGWLPAFRILPPASQQPHQRNLMMILAHLVWGISASFVIDQVEVNS